MFPRSILAVLLAQLQLLTVSGPTELNGHHSFAVQVGVPPEVQSVNLVLLDGDGAPPATLGGSTQAAVVNGTATFGNLSLIGGADVERSVRLVAVAVVSGHTLSGVSLPIAVHVPSHDLRDRTFGGIGVDVSFDKNALVVNEARKGDPAAMAGIVAGDRIEKVDGHPVRDLPSAAGMLGGESGTRVVLSVRSRRADDARDVAVVRGALPLPAVSFDPIVSQPEDGLFQIAVHVTDHDGDPVPGARVAVRLDPAYASAHVLFISTKTELLDATGAAVSELSGTTGADGTAQLWLRLVNATTPFKCRLTATATLGNQTSSPGLSDELSVYHR